MKKLFTLFSATVLFISCQKTIDVQPESAINGETVSSDALTPLPCHTTAFSTSYPTTAGQVPPFQFTKTLYPDTRVKTINMFSRVNPNHSAFKPQAFRLIGTFTYTTNRSKFIGTRETWEYFKTATGGAGKRSLGKKAVNYYFTFDPNTGYCTRVGAGGYTYNHSVVELFYGGANNDQLENAFLGLGDAIQGFVVDYFYFENDSRGNITGNYHVYNTYQTLVSYKYDYTKSGGRYSYQPSQYAICYEYSLLEAMQWLPPSKNPRSNVAVQFYPYGNSSFVKQTQVYKNNTYDSKRNLLSYTYADNVLQKTTWFCK